MGPLRTEAVVLRSIRYGEADRIVHLYTPTHGRLGAIAKGARRARSRFGARLEPFFHTRMVLHQGRSELLTVTSVDTVAAHRALRERADTLDAAARACDAVARLFDSSEPHPQVFALLVRQLGLLSAAADHAGPAGGLAFRLKLLVAAGIVPQLASCAACGEHEHLQGFSAAVGGVVCSACEATGFALGEGAYRFLTGALAAPLADAPAADERSLRQAERAIVETAEYHANIRLRPLLGRRGVLAPT
jgi:DNA repair protein RecO (recombination protein O)